MMRFQTTGKQANTKPAIHDHGWAAAFAAAGTNKPTNTNHDSAASWAAALKSVQE